MAEYKICKELQNIKVSYSTSINLVEGLPFMQRFLIRTIEFYSNSRYLKGQRDELGREKPFYNILNAMCDVENAAKDIDTKDITATSDDGQHYTESFLMSKDIYEWMKKANFAKTLNDMRDVHTRYGSLLVKKCEELDEDGKKILSIGIPEWKNVMTDQLDILGGPIVEVHYMIPRDVLKKRDSWENVEEVVAKALKAGVNRRLPVYEVRGWFPKSYIRQLEGKKPSKKDEFEFTYQLYYLAGEYTSNQNTIFTANIADFSSKLTPLYYEDDTEQIYKYLARKKKAGRDFGVGVMEEGEEAQVWTNDAVLKQNRAMEYTTKVLGQTASKKLKGRNLLTETDDGQVLEHEDGKPITPLQMLPAGGLTQYNNLITQWYQQLEKTTSGYGAQRGETPPSGTPFRLQAQLLQQSGGVYEDLREELGIFITEIFEDWIMPHLAKQLNAEHILAHEFSLEELKEIDRNFSTYHANQKAKAKILSGEIVSAEEYQSYLDSADQLIKKTKTQRFLKVPKDYYKGYKAKITVNVTGEQRNKAAVLESLVNILTVYAKNPAIAQDPVLMQIFTKIVELSGAGISPVSLVGAIQEQAAKQKAMQEQQAANSAQNGQSSGAAVPTNVAAEPAAVA